MRKLNHTCRSTPEACVKVRRYLHAEYVWLTRWSSQASHFRSVHLWCAAVHPRRCELMDAFFLAILSMRALAAVRSLPSLMQIFGDRCLSFLESSCCCFQISSLVSTINAITVLANATYYGHIWLPVVALVLLILLLIWTFIAVADVCVGLHEKHDWVSAFSFLVHVLMQNRILGGNFTSSCICYDI